MDLSKFLIRNWRKIEKNRDEWKRDMKEVNALPYKAVI